MNARELARALAARECAEGWSAKCPAHEDATPSLSIAAGAGGKPLVKCHAGCSQDDVIEALRARKLWPEPEGLTVAALATAKRLPEPLLRESGFADEEENGRARVRMDYRDAAGNVICVRYRGSLIAANGANGPRFWFRKGDKQQLFGLWRLRSEQSAIVVEGETDAVALWAAGFNAIGVPGANAWRDKRFAAVLERCPALHVHVEPDAGGQQFRMAFAHSQLRDRVRFFTVPGAKDPCELRARDPDTFRSVIEAALRAADDTPTAAAPGATNWRSQLRWLNGQLLLDEANVLLALEHDPQLRDLFVFDTFVEELRLLAPVPGREYAATDRYPRKWSDRDTVHLADYLQRSALPRIGREKVEACVGAYAARHAARHPLREYLTALHWDGQARLHRFLADYFGARGGEQPDEYVAEVGRCWLVSAVARVMRPGCQADYMLVLEGPQGILKSKALRILAGDEYFSDSLPHDLGSKDARDHLRGKWIIELSELNQFRRSEIETVKAFLTRREERYRPAYARNEIVYPRQCVFAGSTNQCEYLTDETGNRRFWPVTVREIDVESIGRDREQLWGEAVALYSSGQRWYLDRTGEQLAERETLKRVVTDPWHSTVWQLVDELPLGSRDELTAGDVLSVMDLRESERNPQAAKRIAAALSLAGWKRGRASNRGRLYTRPK